MNERQLKARELVREGDAYSKDEESTFRSVKNYYACAISYDPQYALAYLKHGQILCDEAPHYKTWEKTNQAYSDALKDFNKAIELDPKLALAYRERGHSHKESGKYTQIHSKSRNYVQAILDYKKAIELDPKHDADCYTKTSICCENTLIEALLMRSADLFVLLITPALWKDFPSSITNLKDMREKIAVNPILFQGFRDRPDIETIRNNTFGVIKKLRTPEIRQNALFQALIPETFLGKLFNDYESFKKIAILLQTELKTANAKIMLSEATKKALGEDVNLQITLQTYFAELHQKLVDVEVLPLKPKLVSPESKSTDAKEQPAVPLKVPSAPPAPLVNFHENVSVAVSVKTPSAPPVLEPIKTFTPSAPALPNSEVKEEKYIRIEQLLREAGKLRVDLSDAADRFKCPISREIMIDPVIAADGHNYNRSDIQQWIESKKGSVIISPKKGTPLANTVLTINEDYRADIISYLQTKIKEKENDMSQLMRNRRDSSGLLSQIAAMEVPSRPLGGMSPQAEPQNVVWIVNSNRKQLII